MQPTMQLFLLFALAASGAFACIEEYGTREEGMAAAGGHFTYGYNGQDWGNSFSTCRGKHQSPVMLPSRGAAAQSLTKASAKSSFSYGTLNNPKIVNNGHTLQVSLPADFQSDVKIPIKGDRKTAKGTSVLNGQGDVTYVKATPAQFHFHTHSEHVVSGSEYPAELHIVHFIKPDQLPACAPNGCPAVLGILLALTDKESEVKPELKKLFDAMPYHEGGSNTVQGSINMNALLPEDKTHFVYEGSLTTPPCTEGLLWHVMATPMKITQQMLTHYLESVGDTDCPCSADRTVEEAGSSIARATKDAKGCIKRANGHNFRVTQPMNGRPVLFAS